MGKQGRYIYKASDITDVAAVGITFDGAKVSTIQLNTPSVADVGTRFSGRIEGIVVQVKSISSATKITIRGVTSSGVILLPDTEADIAVSISAATVGTVAFIAGLDWANDNDELNIFCKTDAGTVTVDAVYVSYSE